MPLYNLQYILPDTILKQYCHYILPATIIIFYYILPGAVIKLPLRLFLKLREREKERGQAGRVKTDLDSHYDAMMYPAPTIHLTPFKIGGYTIHVTLHCI